MNKQFFVIAKKNLLNKKLRTILTILGVMIGVASIITLISISNGLERGIVKQFEKIGSDRLFITSKGGNAPGMAQTLSTKELEILEEIKEFEYVTPYLMSSGETVEFNNRKKTVMVLGMPTDNRKRWIDYDLKAIKGQILPEKSMNVVTLGYLFATKMFSKEIPVGANIRIKDKKFKVIGIMDEVGNPQDDNQVYISIDDARELFNKPTELNFIDAKAKSGQDLEKLAAITERKLERVRDKETFNVQSPVEILKSLNDILIIVKSILIAIASISLIVGSIGIMNSMYTSVLERTKDIGVMKSIGATEKNILSLFMLEAGTIGLIGGVLGSLLGFATSYGIATLAASAGFKLILIEFDLILLLGSILFAIVIGLISGYLPAKQASKKKIVEALRYD